MLVPPPVAQTVVIPPPIVVDEGAKHAKLDAWLEEMGVVADIPPPSPKAPREAPDESIEMEVTHSLVL